MRAVIQRVTGASVTINGQVHSQIGIGLLVFLGIEEADADEDGEWLAGKIARMRLFADDAGVMNRSVMEVAGEILVVSQFTLFASTRKGNRPSYLRAARPGQAVPLYEEFITRLAADSGREIRTGVFGADMQVSLVNDGPVTILVDSKTRE